MSNSFHCNHIKQRLMSSAHHYQPEHCCWPQYSIICVLIEMKTTENQSMEYLPHTAPSQVGALIRSQFVSKYLGLSKNSRWRWECFKFPASKSQSPFRAVVDPTWFRKSLSKENYTLITLFTPSTRKDLLLRRTNKQKLHGPQGKTVPLFSAGRWRRWRRLRLARRRRRQDSLHGPLFQHPVSNFFDFVSFGETVPGRKKIQATTAPQSGRGFPLFIVVYHQDRS